MTLPGLRYLIIMGGFCLLMFRDAFFGVLAVSMDYHNHPTKWWWGGPFRGHRTTFLISVAALLALLIQSKKFEIGRILKSPIMLALFALLLFMMLRFSPLNPAEHSRWMEKDIKSALTAIMIASTLKTRGRLRLFFWIFAIGCWGLGIEAWRNPRRESGRLYGVGTPDAFADNAVSAHVALALPFLLDRVIRGKKWEKVIAVPAAAFIVNCIVLASSRGAMLATVMGGFVYTLGILRQPKYRAWGLAVALTGFLGIVFLMDQVFLDRMATLLGKEDEFGETREITGSGRTEIWKAGIPMALEHPFGLGAGGFREASPDYLDPRLVSIDTGSGRGVRSPHNTYLLVAADFGLHSLAVFLFLLFLMCRTAWRAWCSRLDPGADPGRAEYGLVLAAMLASTFVTFMFASRLHYDGFFYLIGILAALSLWEQPASERVSSVRVDPGSARRVPHLEDDDHVAGINIRKLVIALAISMIAIV